MRTKALLTLAALAVSAVTLTAQNAVYSLNVVGYVNKSFVNGEFTLVSNPLKNGGNTLNELIPSPPNGTAVFRWVTANQDLDLVTIPTYSAALKTWSPNSTIGTGEGFFVVGNGNFTNTFVGEVLQGNPAASVSIAGPAGTFQAVGSPVPVGGALLNNVLKDYPAANGDSVFIWLTGAQDFDLVNIPTYSAALSKWSPEANIPVGDGFFLVRNGASTTWNRNFTVP